MRTRVHWHVLERWRCLSSLTIILCELLGSHHPALICFDASCLMPYAAWRNTRVVHFRHLRSGIHSNVVVHDQSPPLAFQTTATDARTPELAALHRKSCIAINYLPTDGRCSVQSS